MSFLNSLVTYFLWCEATGLIKIGKSNQLIHRIDDLSASSVELKLVGVIPGDEERELHRVFAAFRVRREWFEPRDPLLDCIDSLDLTKRMLFGNQRLSADGAMIYRGMLKYRYDLLSEVNPDVRELVRYNGRACGNHIDPPRFGIIEACQLCGAAVRPGAGIRGNEETRPGSLQRYLHFKIAGNALDPPRSGRA